MLYPFRALSYPKRTRITEVRAKDAVKHGDKFDIEARVGGEVPAKGQINIRFDNASWDSFSLTHDDQSVFVHRIPHGAVQSFDYYFSIGDAKSKEQHVKVVPPPRIVKAKVTPTYLKYTQLESVVANSLQIPAVPDWDRARVGADLRSAPQKLQDDLRRQ